MRIVAAGGADITISSPVLSAGADALTNATTGIIDYSLNSAFNGTTWDRVRSEGNDRDGITPDTLGNLQTLGFSHVYNGSTWDRATLLTDASDAVATDTSFGQGTVSRLTGFNGASYDRVRTLGGTSLDGLGQLSVSLGIPGASAVLSNYQAIYNSTTRATMTTPTSGKRIRITAVHAVVDGASQTSSEIYFGTGANLAADPTKVILFSSGRADVGFSGGTIGALDGGGKVGAVDEVVSIRQTGANSTNTHVTIWYREE